MNRQIKKLPVLTLVLVALALQGCHSVATPAPPRIEYLDSKYRICRENCPIRTHKELDDVEPEVQLEPSVILASLNNQVGSNTPDPASPFAKIESEAENENAIQIYFNFGQSKPNIWGRKELRRFLDAANKQLPTKIILKGQTDEIGTEEFNKKLANKRAEYVAAWLKKHGIKSDILIREKVSCCLDQPYDKNKKSLIEERRVSITTK